MPILRRTLIASAPLAGLSLLASPAKAASRQGAPHIIELRTYFFPSAEKRGAFETFLQAAALPAWNRAGARPVGLFKMHVEDNPDWKTITPVPNEIYVLLPHASMTAFLSFESRVAHDVQFLREGQAKLNATKADPAFSRWDTMLLSAFAGRPRVMTPQHPEPEARVFELRTYESHNEERARNKISMFEHGEYAIFDRAGMAGVFFGRGIAGAGLPQLTYMVSHARQAAVKTNWKTFFADPEWKRLSEDAAYKDNVSKVIAKILRPLPGSQL